MSTISSDTLASSNPSSEPDWSQIKQTVLMLMISAAQVEFSLKDGSNSVETLANSFTSMAESIKIIEEDTFSLFKKYDVAAEDQALAIDNCQQVVGQMQRAIIAFQFYDTLVQRLDHVVICLSKLGDLVSDPNRLNLPNEWVELQASIRDRYTMEKERELFDAILSGEDVSSMLEKIHENNASNDDIELF